VDLLQWNVNVFHIRFPDLLLSLGPWPSHHLSSGHSSLALPYIKCASTPILHGTWSYSGVSIRRWGTCKTKHMSLKTFMFGLLWLSYFDVVWTKLWHMLVKCNSTSKLAISVYSTIVTSQADIANPLMSSCSSVWHADNYDPLLSALKYNAGTLLLDFYSQLSEWYSSPCNEDSLLTHEFAFAVCPLVLSVSVTKLLSWGKCHYQHSIEF
jgi:hypothetical protein